MKAFDRFKKVESFTISEFMAGDHKLTKKKRIDKATFTGSTVAGGTLLPLASIPVFSLTTPNMVSAAEVIPVGALGDGVKARIVHSFDPLIDLLQNLSLPLAGVMVTVGGIFVMLGMKEKGYSLLMQAAIGYILLQLSPLFMDLLVSIGESI